MWLNIHLLWGELQSIGLCQSTATALVVKDYQTLEQNLRNETEKQKIQIN